MSLQNRNSLKTFFKKGQLPSEGNFFDLIDSMINKVDDGMSKTLEDGLMLSPIGGSKKLISFYKSIEEKSPAWGLEIDQGNGNINFNNHVGDSVLTLANTGKVGINNPAPEFELDVNGAIAMAGRQGNAYKGKILADGKWHPVLTELNGCHALEIVAGIGKKKTGRYALIHAFALSAFGKSKNKIDIRQAYYGVRSNRIELRWTGTTYNFSLEMRTRNTYDGEFYIQYFISKLWFDQFMDNSVGK
ncbi:MAG: hypothetical protein J7604_10265 [Sporocytophaga sp.]|uniref:hypothetical protein n=1 Tax=Sporocytophaga TaxID=1011 RepID=UPI00048C6B93|nr:MULTISPECIES: hypothetical protein [Sporocytophaga]MBO9700582.1 hypothetical protein [Sporocytophaga sp.]